MQYAWNGELFLAVVCDGMGGMSDGELASAAAVQCVFEKFNSISCLTGQAVPEWLSSAFKAADREVWQLSDENGNLRRAGTTIVAVLMIGDQLYWGSVGDSRIYWLRDDGLHTVNRSHNYYLRIQEMLEQKMISEEQAQRERLRGEALISYIGMGGLSLIDVSPCAEYMKEGDTLLLCSDGLYKALNSRQIQAIVEESGGNMQIAARRLCSEACRLAGYGQDNTTVIAVRYRGRPDR